jgi:single-stranded DNA-binding protein
MSTQRTAQVTLIGNLGGDPETKTLKARTITREVYDDIIDDAVVLEFTTPDRQIRTASLALRAHDADGNEITRWHRLVDFQDYLEAYRKGDYISVQGYFRTRNYLKDGEKKTIREFIVTAAKLLYLKVRKEAA